MVRNTPLPFGVSKTDWPWAEPTTAAESSSAVDTVRNSCEPQRSFILAPPSAWPFAALEEPERGGTEKAGAQEHPGSGLGRWSRQLRSCEMILCKLGHNCAAIECDSDFFSNQIQIADGQASESGTAPQRRIRVGQKIAHRQTIEDRQRQGT